MDTVTERSGRADAAAVRMTGNPAALAAALMKVSEGLVAIPQKDLRTAAVGDTPRWQTVLIFSTDAPRTR